jgi:hypothetical protein
MISIILHSKLFNLTLFLFLLLVAQRRRALLRQIRFQVYFVSLPGKGDIYMENREFLKIATFEIKMTVKINMT